MNKEILYKICKKSKIKNIQIQIHSHLLDEDFVYSTTTLNQKFHSASVGKMMTMVVIVQAIEKGLIGWDTRISKLLSISTLEDLFVFNGIDYAGEITVENLLGHTSGINDYIEGKSTMTSKFFKQIINNPDRFYTPNDLLEITKKYQVAIGSPGDEFLYSDAGYVCLGY